MLAAKFAEVSDTHTPPFPLRGLEVGREGRGVSEAERTWRPLLPGVPSLGGTANLMCGWLCHFLTVEPQTSHFALL